MPTTSRRKFLYGGLMLSAGAVTYGLRRQLPGTTPFASNEEIFVLTGFTRERHPRPIQKRYNPSVPGEVRIFDLAHGTVRQVEVPLFPHGFCQSPVSPNLVVCVEKWTRTAALIDLHGARLLRLFECPDDHRFFGHATFSPAGDHIFVTAVHLNDDLATLAVYRVGDGKLDAMWPTGDRASHEVRVSDATTVLVTHEATATESAFVAEFNLLTRKTQRRHMVPDAVHILKVDETRWLAMDVDAQKRPSLSLIDFRNDKLIEAKSAPQWSPRFSGEPLSSTLVSDHTVITTLPESERILLWNPARNETSLRDVPGIYGGIFSIGNQVFFNEGSGRLTQFSYANGELVPTANAFPDVRHQAGNSRHMYLVKVPFA